ncbi:MAG: polyprenol monophosphomannose synthase [Actinobacteria bacterium]|nr:polyprenol monophosphomannose synthase [Actinomycetota bacterium]
MRTVVVVPTYNEAENIVPLLEAVRLAVPAAEVLVVDDGSPDGTAELAAAAGERLGAVELLRRPVKDGLGNAYREAFAWAHKRDFEAIVQLDADFSHDPRVIPALLAALDEGADVAVGSRYVPGGATPNWPVHRRLLSRWGNRYTGWILRLPMSDATSGFRAYRAHTLEAIHVDTTRSNGYAFMTEIAYRVSCWGGVVYELPIVFTDRVRGTSKMSAAIITESMARVTWWGLRLRVRRPAPHLEP